MSVGFQAALKWRRDALADDWKDRDETEKRGSMHFTLVRLDRGFLFVSVHGKDNTGRVVYYPGAGKRKRELFGVYPEGIEREGQEA